MFTCWGGITLQRRQQNSRKLQKCGLSHGAAHKQPTSQYVSPHTHPLPPPFHGHKMSLGLQKAQIPCFRCTCTHVGYYRPICLCLCVYATVRMLSVHTAFTGWVHMGHKFKIGVQTYDQLHSAQTVRVNSEVWRNDGGKRRPMDTFWRCSITSPGPCRHLTLVLNTSL